MGAFQTAIKPTTNGSNSSAVSTVMPAGATALPANSKALVPVKHQRHYQARGRRFRHGVCEAALRAVTAARMLLRGEFSSLIEAADGCGSCPQYVVYGRTILESGNPALLEDVLAGNVPLREAAEREWNVVQLQLAFRRASAAERIRFGRREGVGTLWDECIAPAL